MHAPTTPPTRSLFHPAKLIHLLPAAAILVPLLALVAIDFLRDLPRRQEVAVNDDNTDPKPAGPAYKVHVEDERDEVPTLPTKHTITDEPEERPANLPGGPVKVHIKDEEEEGEPAAPPNIDPNPVVRYTLGGGGKYFGIGATDAAAAGSARGKRLTYAGNGSTNTTVVRLDGQADEYGGAAGKWLRKDAHKIEDGIKPTPGAASPSHSTWATGPDDSLLVHQIIEIAPGQPVITDGQSRWYLDTVRVRWVLHNTDKRQHKVGLRIQVDTLIGGNDGVPFTVPGKPGLVNSVADFPIAREVPDFVQALEVPSLEQPGTVAHLTLRLSSRVEPPDRLSLTHWSSGDMNWNVPLRNMGSDSAAILYWTDRPLAPGAKRTVGFAYGLGTVAVTDRLGLTLGGSFEPHQHFTATAYVENPMPDQKLTLELPKGLALIEGAETQPVPPPGKDGPRPTSVVTWKVQVEKTGTYRLNVRSSTGIVQGKTITIAQPAVGAGKLALELKGSFDPGQTFDVIARLKDAPPSEQLTLNLPAGLERVAGEPTQPGNDAARWKVKVQKEGKFPVRVSATSGLAQTKTVTITQDGRFAANYKVRLDGEFAPGKVFRITAPTTNPGKDQTLTLQLPAGLERVEGAPTQKATAGPDDVATWQVKTLAPGKYSLGVASSTGFTVKKSLAVEAAAKQTGQFTFELDSDIRPGKTFAVKTHVAEPVADQTLTLVLPPELKLVEGDALQSVPANGQVNWRVEVLGTGRLPVRVESSTGLARTKTLTLTQSGGALLGR